MTILAAIGVDLGATNAKVAVVDHDGKVHAFRSGPTHPERGPDALVVNLVMLLDRALEEVGLTREELIGVGIGAPGPLSVSRGTIINSTNLPGWEHVPLRKMLVEALELPVQFDNDGNAAAYGEWWVGAGREADDLVMLTLGTGVGAGVVLRGQVLHGHFENAAELGHMIVVPDGLLCPCGQHGCLEQYASASGVARRVVAAIEEGEKSSLTGAVRAQEQFGSKQVVEAAQAGDELCRRVWDEACRYLAVACVNIQHIYNPACVVLGGGMASAGSFLLDNVRQHFADLKWHLHFDFPEIVLPELGYHAGVIGAAGYAWRAREEERRSP